MADYNIRGNPVANYIFDKWLAPHKKEEYTGPLPDKPAGLDELPPNVNMSAAPVKNLSDLKRNTPQEQYEHNVQMKNPASAYARKEKQDLKNLTEAAKEAGVLDDDGADTMNISFDKSSAESLLPGAEETDKVTEESKTEEGNTDSKPESKPSEIKPEEGNTGGNSGAKEPEAKAEAKKESRYKIRSIMDAYNEGILDEKSRDYLIVDTLSKFARNMGKDISNIGAAYTGGSQNNEREDSIWSKRNEEMAGKAIGAEGNKLRSEDQYDLDYQSQKLDLAKKNIQMLPARNFEEMANKLRSTDPTAAGFMDLIAAASTQGVDPEEYIAMAYANDPNAKKLVDEVLKAGSTAAGSLSDIMESLNGMGSDMKELTNGLKKKFNL